MKRRQPSKRMTHRLIVDLSFSQPCHVKQATMALDTILGDSPRVARCEEAVAEALDSPAVLTGAAPALSFLVSQQARHRSHRDDVRTLLKLLAEERAARGLDMLAMEKATAIAERWDVNLKGMTNA